MNKKILGFLFIVGTRGKATFVYMKENTNFVIPSNCYATATLTVFDK